MPRDAAACNEPTKIDDDAAIGAVEQDHPSSLVLRGRSAGGSASAQWPSSRDRPGRRHRLPVRPPIVDVDRLGRRKGFVGYQRRRPSRPPSRPIVLATRCRRSTAGRCGPMRMSLGEFRRSERTRPGWRACPGTARRSRRRRRSLTQPSGTVNVKPGVNDRVVWLPAGRIPAPLLPLAGVNQAGMRRSPMGDWKARSSAASRRRRRRGGSADAGRRAPARGCSRRRRR